MQVCRCSGAQVLRCSGAQVLRCSGVQVLLTFLKVKKVTKEGTQNGQNSTWGKTGHPQEGGQKMAKILGGVKFQHFGPRLWPEKCFKRLKKWGRPKIDENRVE